MSNVNLKLNTGLMTFNFRDENEEVFISFKINPSDINLAKRCEEIGVFFENELKDYKEPETFEEMSNLNALYEEKIDYLLGVQDNPVFKRPYTATTFLEDGRILAEIVIGTVLDAVKPEIEKRMANQKNRLDKYTSKYN